MASATPSASSEASFPTFRGSPLWVRESPRSERWWFADGVWLNQGQLGAPVSFGLTHWCADRGLQGPAFDEAFALELHRAINRSQGLDADEEHGEPPAAGVELLQKRGLIADVYVCEEVSDVVTALLERGPVLVGLTWRTSFMSDAVAAGAPIAQLPDGDVVQGGHMVLFNGVDRELELDGVKGFARFKNSWGRDWGDHGHGLMSLDVLAGSLNGAAYLLVPEVSVLRTGVSPEVAIEAERPPGLGAGTGEVESFGEQSIGSDRWTTRDRMGYGAHADAIARAIAHPETAPPLTIGIRAPWGAGKTSLMRMIQERLEWPTGPPPAGAPAALRAIHLEGVGGGRVTHRMLLRAARGAEPAAPPLAAKPKIESGHEAQDEARWRPTVWFNPWMYQTGEQIWAGLAHEIIRQVTERMGPGEREQFWLRLNRKRIDEQAVRRRIYTLVLARVLPWAVGALAMLVAGLVLLATGALTAVGAGLTAAGPVVAAVASGASARRVLAERARGAVSEALGPTGFADLVRTPEYERQSGALFLVQTDLVRVLDLIATPERPLVVFVDDLDRCNPGTVVQVIEAINLFVAGEYPNSIFVVAMEPEMVAAHIEAAYGDLVDKLGAMSQTEQSFDLGWRFLEKVVQLPLTLPSVGETPALTFFTSLFPGEDTAGPSHTAPDEAAVAVAAQQLEGATLTGAVEHGDRVAELGGAQREAVKEAVRRVVERQLSGDSPDVQEVVRYAAGYLDANPREIKRFVNVFRYFVMISTERRLQGLGDTLSLEALAKLAVLTIRWPGLITPLAERVGEASERKTVFALLEGVAPTKAANGRVTKLLAGCGLGVATVERLLADELSEFLRAAPHVGAGADGFL